MYSFTLGELMEPDNQVLTPGIRTYLPPLKTKGRESVLSIHKGALKELFDAADKVLCTGSMHVLNDNPKPNDEDVMLLFKAGAEEWVVKKAVELGVISQERHYPDDIMASYRFNDLNLLITFSPDYFYKWEVCTDIAWALQLENKDHRAYLFERVTSML